MSKMILKDLVAAMQGTSMTYGWDALTLYDQRKTNELLFQLYVDRFNSADGYIKPVSMKIVWGDGAVTEHLYELKLSAPRLSFEQSDPSVAAKARLTMDMVGGMLVSTKKYSGGAGFVSKILKVLPVGGPQLWMDQPVTKAEVTGLGDVVIDIKNADRFRANFVVGDLAQDAVGRRFEQYFEEELTPAQKKFPLGRLQGDLNGVLTPKNFEIRTMKSDPLAVFGDAQYGDGAVMLFITLKDGKDSNSFPGKDSLYLLPEDAGGAQYTGAMLLSSRILFEKFFRESSTQAIGKGIDFKTYDGAYDRALTLTASAGGIPANMYSSLRDPEDSTRILDSFAFDVSLSFREDVGGEALSVSGQGQSIEYRLNKKYAVPCTYHVMPPGGRTFTGEIEATVDSLTKYKVVLNKENGKVVFAHEHSSSRSDLTVTHAPGQLNNYFLHLLNDAKPFVESAFNGIFDQLPSPEVDTFLLQNLLFPGQRALHLTDAFVPGDLALFGQVDPVRTTLSLAPLNSTIEAGRTLRFTLNPLPSDVQWSVKDVDGNLAVPGIVSSTGVYTAPSADKLVDGFVAAMVTAKGTLNGQPVESSALVSVIHSAIVANPMYTSCDPGDTLQLTAQGLGGETLQWKILTSEWNSTLTPVPGEPTMRQYRAGGSSNPEVPFSLDKIEIKSTVNGVSTYAWIHIMIINDFIGTPMLMSEASDPSSGSVQFEIRGRSGPVDPALLDWKLIHGEGTFDDKTGIYAEPLSPESGSFIVVSAVLKGDFQNINALAVVPLPLKKYAELIQAVDSTLANS